MKTVLIVLSALAMISVMAYADFDLGDLPACYPTFFGNPAASMSDKAWLGPCVTAEDEPYAVNGDPCDDGVQFLALPWTPCSIVQVVVTVTSGPNYNSNALFLNGWKDGNMDGDFCDTLCGGAADEWLVHDMPVTPGTYTLTFQDPGVFDIGVYPGVFRWRLTGRVIGREGFGMYDPFDCPDMPMCGQFGADSLGEVEDYWIPDAQLRVALNGFDAIPGDNQVALSWRTASEIDNDHFVIMRDGATVQNIAGAGNSASEHNYSWTDKSVVNGTMYTYTLVSVDANGNREILATQSATPSASKAVVTEYALLQNYPNPFNPSTSITFDLLEGGNTSLRVYNMIGQEVAVLVNGSLNAGRHSVSFDAANLPTGLYVYRLEANGFVAQKKMLLIK